jgi:imidazolonepropionase-like amidohydrolase
MTDRRSADVQDHHVMVGKHPHVAHIGRDNYDGTRQGRRQLSDDRIEAVASANMSAADSFPGTST